MQTVTKQETITYTNDTWELVVAESETGGITYSLSIRGTVVPLADFTTAGLVQLEQIINQAVPSIHSDRFKILS